MIQLFNEDCRETIKRIPDGSIDLMLTDPPYGTTKCEWDEIPNFAEMWQEWERILKPDGVFIITAVQPFASQVILSRIGFFRDEIIWHKPNMTNFWFAKKQIATRHENILIFYRKQPTFNPQKIKSKFKHSGKKIDKGVNKFDHHQGINNVHNKEWHDDNERYLGSVIDCSYDNDRYDSSNGKQNRHPTQKPVDLFRLLIRMYTNENETVFDGYSGSGTTAVACHFENRNFIGSELNKQYYEQSMQRIALLHPQLF